MGLDIAAINLLLCAKNAGVDFSDTLQIGRQHFFGKMPALARSLELAGLPIDAPSLMQNKYSEEFFSAIGAKCISSLDASEYEKATYIHDLNRPIPPQFSQRFSLVYDGGTLEHVFNFSQALKNCMEMVRVGGHFIQLTVANNYMGHGFWQISPEMSYRVFTPENGFQIVAVFLHEVVPNGGWYMVSDPVSHQGRVELVNSAPTYIMTIAKRISAADIFATTPQQSDYSAYWGGSAPKVTPKADRPFAALRRGVPSIIKRPIRMLMNTMKKAPSPFDRPYYLRVSERDVISGQCLRSL
jgi:hypothetical protein